MKPLEKPPPLAPRTSEGSACGRQTLPLTRTLPSRTLPLLHKPCTRRIPEPLIILDTLFVLFLLNYKNLSEAWCHTHCVCRFLFPPQWCRPCVCVRACLNSQLILCVFWESIPLWPDLLLALCSTRCTIFRRKIKIVVLVASEHLATTSTILWHQLLHRKAPHIFFRKHYI